MEVGMRVPRILVIVLVSVLAIAARPASADVVTDWNMIAGQTIGGAVPARPGPSGELDLAMVHAAIHDAIQAFEGRYQPYRTDISNATGSPVAAAAAAAYTMLVALFPPQTASLTTTYNS